MQKAWRLLKTTVTAFFNDEALGRGAAIAFYTVTSIAPVLLIVVAIAGMVFGREAAQNGIIAQLSGLIGQQSAELLQTAVASAQDKTSGKIATVIGVVMVIVTASGVFGEMQTALNVIWKADPTGTPISRLIRARAAGLGLVVSLGFLLMVSLAKRGPVRIWRLPELGFCVWSGPPHDCERGSISSADFDLVRSNLQSSAGQTYRMA